MKNFLTLSLCFLALSLTAQSVITYPYNPDSDGDAFISTTDLIETLASFGLGFTPDEIQIDGVGLAEAISLLETTVLELQQQVYQLLSLGDYYQGGYIFYLDASGQHGLVAAPDNVGGEIEDIYGNSGFPWGCVGLEINSVGLNSSGAIGTGLQNTLDIVNACTETPIAASVCLEYENDGYTDWYLPSFHEMNLMCDVIGMNSIYLDFALFDDDGYWTSNQNYSDWAWYYNFDICSPYTNVRTNLKRARAIRSF